MANDVTLLLIDSDEEFAETLEFLLREALPRADVDWSDDYDDALGLIADESYDLCLVAYHLDDDDERTGLDLIEEAFENGTATPMVLLTERTNTTIEAAAMDSGATDCISKRALNRETLAELVEDLLGI